jgi:hypothetical protein
MEENNSPNLPNPLTKSQVDAVRFQVTKPGYSFEQVEAFIEKTKNTLEFLEKEMKKDKLALAEAEDEIELLTERAQTLSATLEIFKVKGDAVVSDSGEFVTENSLRQTKKLEQENLYLKEQLIAAQEDANAGWQAEAELRKYIEEQLLPWLNENKETIVKNVTEKESEKIKTLLNDEELSVVPSLGNDLDSTGTDLSGSWVLGVEAEFEGESEELLSPNDIGYEEILEHDEHVAVSETPKPMLSSEDSDEWFK